MPLRWFSLLFNGDLLYFAAFRERKKEGERRDRREGEEARMGTMRREDDEMRKKISKKGEEEEEFNGLRGEKDRMRKVMFAVFGERRRVTVRNGYEFS